MVIAQDLYTLLTAIVSLVAGGSVLYLAALLPAAAIGMRRRRPASEVAIAPRFEVIVPAHNEEMVLAATLASLRAQRYPSSRYEVVVVADNCTDSTAAIARAEGVRVLERFDSERRGKGYALDWAITQRMTIPDPADAFVIVDADTWVAPDFLEIMAARLEADHDSGRATAVQGRYGVLNADDNWRTLLMAGAFDLTNHVRPLGYDRLRLGVGLKGNGMMFSRAVLQRVRWRGDSITEDIDYGLELLRQGIRVAYEPEARVLAQMPVTAAQAASQRERWEGGRYRLLRERASGLLWEGLRKRNVPLINAALNLITPPLAELFSLLAVWGLLVVLGRAAGLLRASGAFTTGWTVASAGFATYVLGGLWLSGARWGVYSALLKAPLYVAWKLWLYARRLPALFSQPSAAAPNWIRTERRPISAVEGDEPLSPNKPTQ